MRAHRNRDPHPRDRMVEIGRGSPTYAADVMIFVSRSMLLRPQQTLAPGLTAGGAQRGRVTIYDRDTAQDMNRDFIGNDPALYAPHRVDRMVISYNPDRNARLGRFFDDVGARREGSWLALPSQARRESRHKLRRAYQLPGMPRYRAHADVPAETTILRSYVSGSFDPYRHQFVANSRQVRFHGEKKL